ncbi:transcription-repair coupling factor [Stieleria varia]|uniref:Transcription-repair-coupling factor n=1 Tax=Stieleria varia TaxID=2528005 RepID=A0A5C6BD83_9BACT|nr:transcription-repair coupling factor [Stieleria varia]TWU08404.1 Transcription-repair-coupling factor [Stieleria varia]
MTAPNLAPSAPAVDSQLAGIVHALDDSAGVGARLGKLKPGKPITYSGVWGSLRAALAAAIARHTSNIVMLLPQAADADAVAGDAQAFGIERALPLPLSVGHANRSAYHDTDFVERLQVLQELRNRDANCPEPFLVTAYIGGAMQLVPTPQHMAASTRRLAVGQTIEPESIRQWLAESGFASTTAVQLPGEFASRGGLLDVYSPDQSHPIRIEWFGDEIDSIRRFDIGSQRSVESLNAIEIAAVGLPSDEFALDNDATDATRSMAPDSLGPITDYLPDDTLLIIVDPHDCKLSANALFDRTDDHSTFIDYQSLMDSMSHLRTVHASALAEGGEKSIDLKATSADGFALALEETQVRIDTVAADHQVILVGDTPADGQRLTELLAKTDAAKQGRIEMCVAELSGGFRLVDSKILLLTGAELFHRSPVRRGKTRAKGKPITSSMQLEPGDLVVHLSHGIGLYRGLQHLEKNGQHIEHLVLEYAEGSKIYVPASRIGLIQRYVGGTNTQPRLAKVGGQAWAKQKKAAESAVTDMASELLEMQAKRTSKNGIAFAADHLWQQQFDASFPYQETPDQLTAIAALKDDMESTKPMDRLICGDVGFGKTEVAMRAAFKAVLSGYQVAVLVPTTVLAEQHYHNFCNRMAEFPVRIEKLSRFVSKSEQRKTVADLKAGKVDIVVGTHRLASKDVDFQSLGLVIIDEEQRFGVAVKEKLKSTHTNVDVLTLSATPIPRTLHMALVGVRDISNLETPPAERRAVETVVTRWDDKLIRSALIRELNRGGQAFVVHNRIGDMHTIADRLKHIVPEIRIVIGHGQMEQGELEQVMVDFIDHKYDLLLATTIIESGLDIPNANTMFIDDADHYGLSDLHQLRGRVGRYKHQAFCYLMVSPHKHLSPEATKRLRAIEEFSQMGAGFAISMRDLEIRGAGNLLGSQQSGHISAIGYEMYCQLLEDAVRQIQNLPPALSADVDIDLPVEAYLAEDYVPDLRHKIDLYRRIAKLDDATQIGEIRDELTDRFGPMPDAAERMLELAELRLDAAVWQIRSITNDARFLVLNYASRRRMDQLAKQSSLPIRIVDHRKAYIPLRPQKKPGTQETPPKNHPGIEIDDSTGSGYLRLARQALSLV